MQVYLQDKQTLMRGDRFVYIIFL